MFDFDLRPLFIGLIVIGVGIGLFIGLLLFHESDSDRIYKQKRQEAIEQLTEEQRIILRLN